MSEETLTIEFPLSTFTDDQLAGLSAATVVWNEHSLQALAVSVGMSIQCEAMRRTWNRSNPDKPPKEPGYFAIRFGDWSDKDLGQALLWAWAFTSETKDPKFGQLVDEIARAIVYVASFRLINSDDSRNIFSFDMRNIREDGADAPAMPQV